MQTSTVCEADNKTNAVYSPSEQSHLLVEEQHPRHPVVEGVWVKVAHGPPVQVALPRVLHHDNLKNSESNEGVRQTGRERYGNREEEDHRQEETPTGGVRERAAKGERKRREKTTPLDDT